MQHICKQLLDHRLEVFSAIGIILWGAWLLNPFVDSFVRFSSYGEMAKRAPENVWGGAAVAFGVISLDGIIRDHKQLRRLGMLGVILFRSFQFVFIGIQQHFASNGIPDFLMWTVMAIVAYIRIDNDG